jgi:hypothetical protein
VKFEREVEERGRQLVDLVIKFVYEREASEGGREIVDCC